MRRTPLIATATVVAAVGALLSTAATGSVAAPLTAAAGASVPAGPHPRRRCARACSARTAGTPRPTAASRCSAADYAVHTTGPSASVDDGRRAVTGPRLGLTRASRGRRPPPPRRPTATPAAAGSSSCPGAGPRPSRGRSRPTRTSRCSSTRAAVGSRRSPTSACSPTAPARSSTRTRSSPCRTSRSRTQQRRHRRARSAYKTVTLANLDGSGYLKGSWANVTNSKRARTPSAFSSTLTFTYTRSDTRFEQVNGYYGIDPVADLHPVARLHRRQQRVPGPQRQHRPPRTTPTTPRARTRITFGTGGVDDAEDDEVDLARVRPRHPGRPGARLRHRGPRPARSARASATTRGSPCRGRSARHRDHAAGLHRRLGLDVLHRRRAALPAPHRQAPRSTPTTSPARCTTTARSGRTRCSTSTRRSAATQADPDHPRGAVRLRPDDEVGCGCAEDRRHRDRALRRDRRGHRPCGVPGPRRSSDDWRPHRRGRMPGRPGPRGTRPPRTPRPGGSRVGTKRCGRRRSRWFRRRRMGAGGSLGAVGSTAAGEGA